MFAVTPAECGVEPIETKTPELVLKTHNGKIIGICSSCPESVFKAEIEVYDEHHFKRAFNVHLKAVHMSEDARLL
jgi:hypothetical protein